MINSQEIKIGTCIRMDGKVWVCIDFQHRKPGKGNMVAMCLTQSTVQREALTLTSSARNSTM